MMQRACNRIFSLLPRVSAGASTSSSASYCTDEHGLRDDDRRRGSHIMTSDKTFVNSCTLVGNVGNDPEERGSGLPIAIFPLLTVSFSNHDEGGQPAREFKHWHRILVANNNQREKVLRQIRKGDKVYVTGSIKQSKLADGSFTSYILGERVLRLNQNRRSGFEQRETRDQMVEEAAEEGSQSSEDQTSEGERSGQSFAN